MMIEFSKPIKNDGSEAFRKCVMDFCLAPKAKTIRITKEDIEQLLEDRELTVVFEKTIGGTTYIVEYAVSDCAKETAYDKVKKLILNDTESYQNVKAS